MYTNELDAETLQLNFEHWLSEAIRSGVRNAQMQPLTPLTMQTWAAIDAVADAAAALGSQSAQLVRLNNAVAAARHEFERQLDGTHRAQQQAHTEMGRATA